MFKMIVLLAAGAFVYTMGHNAASASTDEAASAKPQAAWEQVATTGGTWIAREIHEQTAWAAQSPSSSADQPAAVEIQPRITFTAG